MNKVVKKIAAVALSGLLVASVFAGCSGGSAKDTYTVGICQSMQHPALDKATEGFKKALTDKLGDKVTFKEQNAAGAGGEALPVGADAAGAAQDVAQLHLLVQVHGAVDHVDDEHRAVGQFGVRDQLIFVVQFHIFTKSHHCRDVEADLSVISLPLSLIITVSEQKNKAELPDGPEFQPRFCKNTGRKYEKRNLLRR